MMFRSVTISNSLLSTILHFLKFDETLFYQIKVVPKASTLKANTCALKTTRTVPRRAGPNGLVLFIVKILSD